MIKYLPADLIVTLVGGQGFFTIFTAAVFGAPAYLNGYAAVPLVDALMNQGMSKGAAMSFMIAGGISSIPAAIAVPITPATLGPIACINKKFCGLDSRPTLFDTRAAIGTAETPAEPINGLIFV